VTKLPTEHLESLKQLLDGLGDAAASDDTGSDTDSEGEPDSEDGTGPGSAVDGPAEAEGTSMLSRAFFKRVAPAKGDEVELLSRLAFQLVMGSSLEGAEGFGTALGSAAGPHGSCGVIWRG
jgi:hypothetical protein